MKKLVPLLLLFISINIYAQKEANVWYFGENAGLDFNRSPPLPITNGKLNTLEGCSSFADANGRLLFYSDGITVWDKNQSIMKYTNRSLANNLRGNPSSSQSGMIIPKPGSATIFYLFTVGDNQNPAFSLYTIDMSLNGGLGELIDENGNGSFFEDLGTPTGVAGGWTEKVAAVRGHDCDTFWVVTSSSNKFFSYKVDAAGVNTTPVVSTVNNFASRTRGYLKLSPDGTKLAIAHQAETPGFLLYSFDDTTGIVANDGISMFSGGEGQAYGIEFSRNSQKLYVSTTAFFTNNINNPSTYKLFQFDLSVVNIAASKRKIHEQNGFRGALQLGPDGKIYATIPQTYSDSDGFAEFLDVIENPNANAADVIFRENAISLNGRKATQGLPPFISSLLLPIIIKDPVTGNDLNDQDLQFCTGENKTITPDLTHPSIVNAVNIPIYEWTFDDGTGGAPVVIANIANLTLNALTAANNGNYKLKVTLTDMCGNNTALEGVFNITVYEVATATQPNNINFCDTDNDGFNSFNLQTDKNATILNGLLPATFDVLYYLTQADADANTNALANPYTNPTAFSSQTIYARVHNKNASTACYATTNFTLAVTGLPIPQDPTDYEKCDDVSVGTDTDGLINHFRLNTRDTQILGALDPVIYKVSYHTTLVGAQTDNTTDVIDKTIDYTNTTANSQTVFVRVENVNNTVCHDANKTLNLVVNPLPVIDATVELKQCDDDIDGFSDFNLFEAATDISANHANETFTFFPTLADAVANSNIIPNPTTFRNRVIPTDKVWARATSSFDCYRISEITLTVSTTGIPAAFQRAYTVCDDFLDIDGNNTANNNDTDGIATFNFSAVTAEIIAIFPANQQLTVSYYRNPADALAENNAIADPSNYRNIGYANTQNIYIRVDSNLDNDCLGFGHHITLTVDSNPTADAVNDLELCDDFNDGNGTNGIVQTFNLSSQTATILGAQNPTNFTVTYHLSAADANSDSNAVATPAAFTNTVRDLQTIYVRVTNNNGGCFTDHTSFDLIVHPLPIANFVEDIEVCDDNSDGSARNGFSQSINLAQQTATILGNQDPNQFSVSYHISLANAQNNIFPLVTTNYSNVTAYRETVFVRVFNANTGCANGISNFDIIINPEPLANPDNTLSNLSVCDDNNGGLGDDTDRIVENIDLDSQIPTILGLAQDPDDYNVTFHRDQADASSGANPLISPYTNTSSTETIFVRIQNKATNCINDDLTFDVIINALPDFQITTPQIACLNNLPKSLGIENPNDVYDYVWKDKNGAVISTNSTADISSGGLYSVTATSTTGTNCTRTRSIQVNESIIATLIEADVTIVDDSENNSISINNVNDHLGIGDYEYALTDENGNFIRIYQDETLFENLEGNIYNILIRDKNGCGIKELLIPVVQFPKFFTPNNDGINDVFQMRGVNKTFFPISEMYIYNRYGKVVANVAIDGLGWDGTYNGKTLVSDDYWFSIKLVDRNGVRRELKGNFSLLRK